MDTPSPLPLYRTAPAIAWLRRDGLVPYPEAVAWMEARVAAIRDEAAAEAVWLVEHPPLYTAGTSAATGDLVDPDRFPVFATARGGRYTYHGPGQRVAYVLLDLARRGGDVRAFVAALEDWLIACLAHVHVKAVIRPGKVGVWVPDAPGGEAKIAAIGLRVRRGVSYHGISLNIDPDLSHFAGIIPCGIADQGVTSLKALGLDVTMAEVDRILAVEFVARFGPLAD